LRSNSQIIFLLDPKINPTPPATSQRKTPCWTWFSAYAAVAVIPVARAREITVVFYYFRNAAHDVSLVSFFINTVIRLA